MLSLLLTGLLATTVALASDDSSGATKTVLVSAPGLLRPPVLQGSRFVVSSGQRPTVVDSSTVVVTGYHHHQQQQQEQQEQDHASPVRAATTSSSSEGNVVPHYQSEVSQPEQSATAAGLSPQAFYSPYLQYYDYSHRRYVPSSYVYPPPYLYPSSSGAVQHPFLGAQQSPVIQLDALFAPVQILVRTPTGLQVFRPVPYSRPPVHYIVGVFPPVSEQQQGSKQSAAQEHTLVTKVEVPSSSEVANETQNSGDTSPAAAVSLASSAAVTEVVPAGGLSTGETKAESSVTSDSF